MKHYEDCDTCRFRVDLSASVCSTCSGKGIVPVIPPVSEWVVWREPLDEIEIEFMEKDAKAYPPIPRLRPMLIMRAARVSTGGRTFVEVTGYVIKMPMCHPQTVRTTYRAGDQLRIREEPVMPHEFMREVEGPSREPGCWNWKGQQ